uniref:Putative secreted protein n=1 Tax=Panstrongylus lignarius TaxID=156445 RepID=A0A224XST3_9HEMI
MLTTINNVVCFFPWTTTVAFAAIMQFLPSKFIRICNFNISKYLQLKWQYCFSFNMSSIYIHSSWKNLYISFIFSDVVKLY